MSSKIMTHALFHFIALLNFLLLPFSVSRADQWRLQTPLLTAAAVAVAEEEKSRLGSTPPSCHNRCNACNPCTAVQVPTFSGAAGRFAGIGEDEVPPAAQAAYGQYSSNYKPLGWKCRCGGQVYNP